MNLLVKIKYMMTTDMVRVSFLNGISTVIKMITGLISIKIVSVIIGPSGIALLGQLGNFSAIVLIIANGGINVGITKYVSEHADDKTKYNLFLSTGIWITVAFSIITGIALIAGAGYFSALILHDTKYKIVFYIFGGTVIFYALNAFLISVINGFKDYNKYIIANILGSFVGLIFTISLSLKYGTTGALVSSITFQSVVFILTLVVVGKTRWFKIKSFLGKFSKVTAVRLGHYSIMALVSAITVPGSQLFVRGYITKTQSITQAGLWEGMNRISFMYLFVIMTSLSVYYLPRLAELKSVTELKKEIYSVYKLMIPFMVVSICGIFFLRDFLINLLFTKEFSGMRSLFGFQLLGDFLRMLGWVLGYVLIAKAMTKTYVILEFMNLLNAVVFNILFINSFGTIGATIGYVVVNFIYLMVTMFLLRKIVFYNQLKDINHTLS